MKEIYDLHVWAMSTTQTALSVHLLMPSHKAEDDVLNEIRYGLHEQFEITHPTIQIMHNENNTDILKDCVSGK